MRNNDWLVSRLEHVWNTYFYDVDRLNTVVVRFKGKWKNKLGHIKKSKGGSTEIVINSLFTDDRVPEFVVDLTLAHELVHYMHGFNSPHVKRFSYPHKGNIVNKELVIRGLKDELKEEKRFMKQDWPSLYKDILLSRY